MSTLKKSPASASSTKTWAKKFVKHYKPALKELAKNRHAWRYARTRLRIHSFLIHDQIINESGGSKGFHDVKPY